MVTEEEGKDEYNVCLLQSIFKGYMVRDMQGAGRQLTNGTFRSDNVFQHYSRLDLISKNVTYHTLW